MKIGLNLPYTTDLSRYCKKEKSDIIRNTNILDFSRFIYVIQPNQDNEAGSVIIKNVVKSSTPPLIAKNCKISESTIISTFLFEPNFLNENYINGDPEEKELRLICGISTGFALLKPNGFINYGISILNYLNGTSDEMVYSMINDKFVEREGNEFFESALMFENPYLNNECEYIGSIHPLYFTEDHYEYITGNKYKINGNYIEKDYYLKDFDTEAKIFNISINSSAFNTEIFYMEELKLNDLFSELSFLCLAFDFLKIGMVIDNGEFNIDWDNVSRSTAYNWIKNNNDMKDFLLDVEVSVKSIPFITNYYCVFNSDEISFSFTYKNKITGSENTLIRDKGLVLGELINSYVLFRKHIVKDVTRIS